MAVKRILTIAIVEGEIVIDEKGQKGGRVHARSRDKIKWERDPKTVDSFSLEFFCVEKASDLLAENTAKLKQGLEEWPFDRTHATVPGTVEIDPVDGKVFDAQSFKGRLADFEETAYYFYTVRATPVGGGPCVSLDPPIIIDPI